MVSIARACEMVGVARSTLLYYERIGIIAPGRHPENGYREYARKDIHALVLIRQLQKAGFSLKEAHAVMKGDLDGDLIEARFHELEQKIRELSAAREVVRSLVVHATGKAPETRETADPEGLWHAELERTAGDAHAEWLGRLGFDEKQQLYIRWVTRSLVDSVGYMKDFFFVFERMKRQGPGSCANTQKVFDAIPDRDDIRDILELGCGKGQSCLELCRISKARVTAIDNHQPFLDHVAARAKALGYDDNRLRLKNMSMSEMDVGDAGFDLVWSEGSAYFMGFEKALAGWKRLIRPGGHLFVSDVVWLTDKPSPDCAEYFRVEYPGMQDVRGRKQQVMDLGYEIVKAFILPQEDWIDFYNDMEACVAQARQERGPAPAFDKLSRETAISRTRGNEYGCICLLLRPA